MSIIDDLVEDPDNFLWQDLAFCKGDDTARFFEKYESDKVVAAQIDARCFVCPVQKLCLLYGMENKEQGVWGGVYLAGRGIVDKSKNDHKTEEDWNFIRNVIESQ